MSLVANFWRRVRCICNAGLTREGLAFGAFLLSAGAGPILTAMLFWAMVQLDHAGKHDEIFKLACGLLLTLGLQMWSVHRLLGSKQAIEAEFLALKLKMVSGGDQ